MKTIDNQVVVSRNIEGDLIFIKLSDDSEFFIPLAFNRSLDANIRAGLDIYGPRNKNYFQLNNTLYPESYYKERFDIYFNSFGNRPWLKFPDKRVELLIVNNKSQRPRNGIGSLEGTLKNNCSNSLVHPSNANALNVNNPNGIFSGGSGGKIRDISSIENLTDDYFLYPTEFTINETRDDFGWEGFRKRNKLNNPNITVELDIRKYFRDLILEPVMAPPTFKYPCILYKSQTDEESTRVRVRGNGDIKWNSAREKAYRRNLIVYFRLSAGVPSSLDTVGKAAKYIIMIEGDVLGDTVDIDFGNGYTGVYTNTGNPLTDLGVLATNLEGKFKIQTQYLTDQENPRSILIIRASKYIPDFMPIASNATGSLVCTIKKKTNSQLPNVLYKKRIYSDLSLPIYICPRIDRFYDDVIGQNDYQCSIYGHKVTIGHKS